MKETTRNSILMGHATICDALRVFDKTAMSAVLLCDDKGLLLGVVSEGDVRRAQLNGHKLEHPLADISNTNPVIGRSSMSREELVALLNDHPMIHFLPVLDEQGVVVDIFYKDSRTFIPIAMPIIGELELKYVTDAVLSGWVSSQGKYIERFENMLTDFCKTEHAVVVSNGTVALHLALVALGIGPGDEVIVPALTFIASANAVTYCGAKPVFVDVDPKSWTLDPDAVEAAISEKTKAIMPVHLYGNPCDMGRIMEIANRFGLWVVEDAAEAHGATYDGRPVGSIGHVGCFSFFGNKMITTGEGGAAVCNDAVLAEKMRVLRDHGMSKDRRYWHEVVGYNYRMTNLQAALGVAQLERWDMIINRKEEIRALYRNRLAGCGLQEPDTCDKATSVCWIYTVRLPAEEMSRDQLIEVLKERKTDVRPVFFPIPAMPPYYEANGKEKYPVTYALSESGFSLPSFVELSDDDILHVGGAVQGWVRRQDRPSFSA